MNTENRNAKVFTIFDSKAEAYLQPFMVKSVGEALRMLKTVVNDGKSGISQYPADYHLFQIAEWDELKGEYLMLPTKISLGCALELKDDQRMPIPQLRPQLQPQPEVSQ